MLILWSSVLSASIQILTALPQGSFRTCEPVQYTTGLDVLTECTLTEHRSEQNEYDTFLEFSIPLCVVFPAYDELYQAALGRLTLPIRWCIIMTRCYTSFRADMFPCPQADGLRLSYVLTSVRCGSSYHNLLQVICYIVKVPLLMPSYGTLLVFFTHREQLILGLHPGTSASNATLSCSENL